MNKKQEIKTDRISSLPDELLVQILSLVSLKEAVSTSLLATRWRNLWAQVPNLHIKEQLFSTRSHFIDFVGRAMALRGQTSIGVFSLECAVEQDASVITKWIETAARCNVKQLDLYLWNDGSPYLLPPSIFESEKLEIFKLNSSCVLAIPSPKPVPKLKVLYLNKVIFVDDDSATRLFAGPSLLAITLKRCKWMNLHHIHIYAPKLQYLSINDYMDRSKNAENFPYKDVFSYDRRIEINGASLGTFKYKGEAINEYKLSGVNWRLVEANIHVNCVYPGEVNTNIVVPRVCRLLSDVSKVQALTVSPALLEHLAIEGNGEDLHSLPDFSLLEELFVDGPIDSFGFRGLCMILRRSGRLCRLGLWEFKQKPGNPDFGWLANPIPTCFLTCMKEITVQCLYDQAKEMVERDIFILRQLLKSVVALEHMEIHYRTDVIKTKVLKRRLAKFPVGSKGIKFSLVGSYFIFCPITKISLGTGHIKDYLQIGKEESYLSRCRSR